MWGVGTVTTDAANAALSIWLLGEFRVAVDGRDVPAAAWRRSKARAMVKLLALAPGHRLHREQLMESLWPDLDPDAAGANLRKALHFARGALGADSLRVSSEIVRLDAATLWIDVDAFEDAVRAGNTAAALALYTDDLLLEDRFEPWCERRRDQLRTTAAQLLLDQSLQLERRGNLPDAIAALECLITLEPVSEAGHCGLIRLHALSGRRDVALRWFRQLEERLRDELGVEPGDEARRLRDEILAGGFAAEESTPGDGGVEEMSARLDEERKLVTIVVAELGGGSRAKPERIRAELDTAANAAADVFRRWGGRPERQIGGTVVAVFGVPSAGERDAELAIRAALEVAEQATVPVRLGIDTGVVVAPAALEGGLRALAGEAFEIAGRLRELAPAGGILATERTCRTTRDVFEVGEREELPLTAGTSPSSDQRDVAAHRILATRRSTVARPPLPMVGRDAQLEAVLGVFGDVAANGRPHLLSSSATRASARAVSWPRYCRRSRTAGRARW